MTTSVMFVLSRDFSGPRGPLYTFPTGFSHVLSLVV